MQSLIWIILFETVKVYGKVCVTCAAGGGKTSEKQQTLHLIIILFSVLK